VGWLIVSIPAWIFLGGWFAYQLVEANFGLLGTGSSGGVAFFAHVGGFAFGYLVARVLVRSGRIAPQDGTGLLRQLSQATPPAPPNRERR
jgi:membrane associated rhomboid family serine protease